MSLQKLEQKLIDLDTDPDLQALLLLLLDNWRFDRTLSADLPPYLTDLAQKQALLGGNHLLEGWLRPDWQRHQQRYFHRIRSKRNGRRWLVAVIGSYGTQHGTCGTIGIRCSMNRTPP
jgi:hypothetical protein